MSIERSVPPDRQLAIEYVSPQSLKPDPGNARVHNRKQRRQIEASFRRFGFVNPALTDEHDHLIAGHGRVLAAIAMGIPLIPRIVIPGLTAVQKKALALADNKIALNAAWDADLLKDALMVISVEFEPEEVGFEAAEIDVIVTSGQSDPDDDTIPPPPKTPVARQGDIWIVAGHRIACGDSRAEDIIARLMAGAVVAMVFADPPYNVPVDGHVCGKGAVKHGDFAMAVGEMSVEQFIQFLLDALGPAVRVSRSGAVHFICMDHRHVEEVTAAAARLYGARLNICVWRKSNAGMGSLYRSQHELVFVYRVGDAPHRNNVELGRHGRNRTNVWEYASVNTFGGSRQQDLALHPTVKPVGLVADAIMDVTKRGEVVFDPFLGSGTTLIACERTGRLCRGVEFDPAYVDVALERFRIMTGIEPILAETGETFSAVAARRAGASGEG